ncbi:hypothetical protein TVAG_077470 [Trichomonas vaginalis G3]|uniref:Uncharacterized protein n=1 Tax=Trichomonas vaginalis (strain ATCC PRA-98 / G3) TaxID=412133 RepID=A2E2V4_TRIV3|nr:hypothetical protein TVAG_077470 [Trichomonas vaginalis G3]|eukprot:XP_001325232.1 hypothetical protein [Trichomonas vaginalis G3]
MAEYPDQVENGCKKVEKQLHKLNKRISTLCLKSPPSVTEILASTHNSDMKIAYTECKFKKEKMKIIELEKLKTKALELEHKNSEINKLKRRLLALQHLKEHSIKYKSPNAMEIVYTGKVSA